jgi:hypothetical protein
MPLAFARCRPSSVLVRIRWRSNSASPPSTVSINRPWGVVVSAQGSPRERKLAPASQIVARLTNTNTACECLLEAPRVSLLVVRSLARGALLQGWSLDGPRPPKSIASAGPRSAHRNIWKLIGPYRWPLGHYPTRKAPC